VSDVACLNRCHGSKTILPPEEKYKEINVHRMNFLDLKYYRMAPQIIRMAKNYDIIHIHGIGFFSDFLSLTKFIHKKKIILSTHGGIFHTGNLNLFKKIYFHTWCKVILKNIDKTIADSKNDYDKFSGITNNIVFIPNGVSLDKLKSNPDKKNIFLYLGRISKNKRIDNLIETIRLLKKHGYDYKLYIIGKDWDGMEKDLKKSVAKNGLENNVIFKGEVSEKEKIKHLSEAKFFLSASEYEGFGISLLEAMASGCVVIANDIDAFRNIVENNKNGFLINFSKPGESFKHMIKIVNKKSLKRISENAAKDAKKYNWAELAIRIEDVYEKI
jgi:alpha-1,3-mannosyltransferase